MRWLVGSAVTLLVVITLYLGSAFYALGQIAGSVRAGDGPAVLARTDLRLLSRSLTEQIMDAYLARIGATRKLSATERMLANTYGASIADAMVSKMLTPDRLTEMLKTGSYSGEQQVPGFTGLASLADLKTGDILDLLGRVRVVQPVLLSIRVSNTSTPDDLAAIALHFEGNGWKLAGINLPPRIVRQLAASLPMR